MNSTQITINVSQGGIVNIHNYTTTPYITVKDNTGMPHTFYSKREFDEFKEQLSQQR